jgi:2-C-methyl-D-erythritol 4-phosphate cytidylyltransferase
VTRTPAADRGKVRWIVASFAVILPAAGKSSRFRDRYYKKPFAPLENRAVWLHAADHFVKRDDVHQVILVISSEDQAEFQSKFQANVTILGIDVVLGGASRADSVGNALAKVRDEIEFIAVHDAARPCLADEWIDQVFAAAEKSGAAILGVPVASTLKRVSAEGLVEETVARDGLWEAQTPQVFAREVLLEAYRRRGGFEATDEAQLVERTGHPVTVVRGSPINLKVTTKDDLRLAAYSLKAHPRPKTLGGLHPFENDDLWR